MFSKHSEVCVGMVCALSAAIAQAQTVSNWISNSSGIWNDPDHWFPVVPDATVDAKHLKKLNHIQVAGDRSCRSFEGKGGSADRFLLIRSSNELSVFPGGLFKSTGIGTGANFVVKFEDGTASESTKINVTGLIDGIDFVPAPRQNGDHIDIWYWNGGGFKDSTIALGDDANVFKLGTNATTIDSTSITLGDDCEIQGIGTDVMGPGDHSVGWTIGDRGTINVLRNTATLGGDLYGIDMAIGTSAATSSADTTHVSIWRVGLGSPRDDHWTLRGFADVSVEKEFRVGAASKVSLRDKAQLSFESNESGAWEVRDSALVTSSVSFTPDSLLIDGASVRAVNVGDSFESRRYTIRNGGRIIPNGAIQPFQAFILPGTLKSVPDSTLTYGGGREPDRDRRFPARRRVGSSRAGREPQLGDLACLGGRAGSGPRCRGPNRDNSVRDRRRFDPSRRRDPGPVDRGLGPGL